MTSFSFKILLFLSLTCFLFYSQLLFASLAQTASSLHEPEEKMDLKLYLGSFALKQVDKMQSIEAGVDYAGRFSDDRFEFKNHYDVTHFQIEDYYNKAKTSFERHRLSLSLMANLISDNLSFLTYMGGEKSSQSQKRSTHAEFDFGLLGVTYWLLGDEKVWREVSIGYIPMYVFLNLNKLNSENKIIGKSSYEYLVHTLYFNLLLSPLEDFYVRAHLSYGIVKNLKKGDYEMSNNEIKNQVDFVFQVTKNIELFYRNEYIQDKKRTYFYNLPATDMSQSFNFAYDFAK